MPTSAFVQEANTDNFDALVLENSRRGLVLVHFWSPKAGPCMLLTPRLIQLAEIYTGRFLLVLANTDMLGRIAHRFGVTSVPTVKFFHQAEVVHTIHGAESDATFRVALNRFIAQPEDALRLHALAAHQAGNTEEALTLLARAAVEKPEDLAIAADLAKLLTLSGKPEQALNLFRSLPKEARLDGRIAPLLAHLELIEAAASVSGEAELDSPEVDSPAKALAHAARALFDDQLDVALNGLLTLAFQHPEFRDDIGRRALLALFGMLGPDHAMTRAYRAKLAAGPT